MKIYVVNEGDNVDKIAQEFGIPTETLTYDNQIVYPYRLAVGQALIIPDSAADSRPGLYVSGYAYPFIRDDVLEATLPWLTSLNVFSYGFTTDGNLVPPAVTDVQILQKIKSAGVRPVLTLTPLDANGAFNNHLVTAVVHNRRLQQKLVWNLGALMLEKGYEGLDIDFEYVQADDREAFAQFVAFTTRVMNEFGYLVTVALAPKTSRDQVGLLYEGIDYRLLGEAANRVFLMTYEWGYTYGPPMAVAPINMVRRVVDYAVSEISTEKITMGIPNYGYDWPLPYVRGTTRARTLHTLEAISLAIDFGVPIRFDETAQSPYFRYWQYGIQHEVWFEDPRSLLAKFNLIREFGLTGAGYWQLMNFYRPNWLLLHSLFTTRRY